LAARGESVNKATGKGSKLQGEIALTAFEGVMYDDNDSSHGSLPLLVAREASSVDSNSINDDFFDNFGGNDYVSEDNNEDIVILEWILDGLCFVEIEDKDEDKDDYSHDLCMVNCGVNFKFPWTTQETASLKLEPDGCKLDDKSIQSYSTTSKNYYSCLSEDESEAVVIAKPIGLGRWTPGKRWTKPRSTNNNKKKTTKKINKKPARNNTERPRQMKYGG
jgi:hypothetical protein